MDQVSKLCDLARKMECELQQALVEENRLLYSDMIGKISEKIEASVNSIDKLIRDAGDLKSLWTEENTDRLNLLLKQLKGMTWYDDLPEQSKSKSKISSIKGCLYDTEETLEQIFNRLYDDTTNHFEN